MFTVSFDFSEGGDHLLAVNVKDSTDGSETSYGRGQKIPDGLRDVVEAEADIENVFLVETMHGLYVPDGPVLD